MNGNIRVGNLFGIPFYVNPSWFFILGLMTLTYGGQLASFPQLGGIFPWILGLVASLLLFASVTAHELGHSFVALAQGIEVKSITLFIFGGLASLEKESDTPKNAFLVAIAGPLVSLILFGLFTLIGVNLALPGYGKAIVSLLAAINLMLALFNLIPGLPLDGGNILKALVWQITGNPHKGIIFASRVGQLFGWLAIIIGGLGVIGVSPVGNVWTILIGWFLRQNAGFSAQSAAIADKLNGLTAADAVMIDSPVIPEYLTLRQFVNDYVIGKEKWRRFLVTNEAKQLLGVLDLDDIKKVATSEWNHVLVKDLMHTPNNLQQVSCSLSLLEVSKILEQEKMQQLTVVGDDGVVVGLLEKTSIINLLQQQAQGK